MKFQFLLQFSCHSFIRLAFVHFQYYTCSRMEEPYNARRFRSFEIIERTLSQFGCNILWAQLKCTVHVILTGNFTNKVIYILFVQSIPLILNA